MLWPTCRRYDYSLQSLLDPGISRHCSQQPAFLPNPGLFEKNRKKEWYSPQRTGDFRLDGFNMLQDVVHDFSAGLLEVAEGATGKTIHEPSRLASSSKHQARPGAVSISDLDSWGV